MATGPRWAFAASAVIVVATGAALVGGSKLIPPPPVVFEPVRAEQSWPTTTNEARDEALRRATVWQIPSTLAAASTHSPDRDLLSQPFVVCRFLPDPPHGTTPKFDCTLPDGETVKVKYGSTLEIQGEVAASGLLRAVGLGADRMYLVRRLRCYGCPPAPYQVMRALDIVGAGGLWDWYAVERWYTDFEWVAVERRFEGRPIEGANERKGWAWSELGQVDPRLGATRAEIDALRLMAVFLAHWDNKMENQRLVCLSEVVPSEPQPCPRPFALIHDVGSTFGPRKVNLEGWRKTPMWTNPHTCTVSMHGLPYDGATFEDATISEGGRQLFLDRIGALTPSQISSLFSGARFDARQLFGRTHPVEDWVRTFQDKVKAVRNAGPCRNG